MMSEAMDLINTLIRDWWLLMVFFTAGGIYWQLKSWFDAVNLSMSTVSQQHQEQSDILIRLDTKVANIESDVSEIRRELSRVHEEVHNQEIKLAVLETQTPRARAKRA